MAVVIESGEVFTYQRPSEKEAPCCKSESEDNRNEKETHHSPKHFYYIGDNLTFKILGSHPCPRNCKVELHL